MASLVGHTFAQSQPQADQDQSKEQATAVPCIPGARSHQDSQKSENYSRRSGGSIVMPCAGATGASAAAVGNLTPLYVGAGVIGAAVAAGALNGGGDGHHDPAGGNGGGTGGTSGTTGTH